MPVAVVKLGSSVVAHEGGDLRLSVVARLCEEVAGLHRAGVDVVVVTSGAIARGIRLLDLPQRPDRDRRAAGRERRRPGPALPHVRRAAARGGAPDRAGAAHVLRHERAHALPQRAPDAARRCSAGGSCRSSTRTTRRPRTRSPSATTTSSPPRSRCSSNAELLVLLTDTDGLYTANPRQDPSAQLVQEVRDPAELDALEIGHEMSPLGSGGMRSKVVAAEMATAAGIPTVIASGFEPGTLDARVGRGAGRHPLRAAGRAALELQALAQVREARPGRRDRRRGRRAGAARGRHEPAAGRDRRRRGGVRRRRRGPRAGGGRGARSARGSSTTRPASCAP